MLLLIAEGGEWLALLAKPCILHCVASPEGEVWMVNAYSLSSSNRSRLPSDEFAYCVNDRR